MISKTWTVISNSVFGRFLACLFEHPLKLDEILGSCRAAPGGSLGASGRLRPPRVLLPGVGIRAASTAWLCRRVDDALLPMQADARLGQQLWLARVPTRSADGLTLLRRYCAKLRTASDARPTLFLWRKLFAQSTVL